MRETTRSVLAVLIDFVLNGVVGGNLLVILLKGSKILTSLRELTLLHTLTNVPVDKGTLGVHEIELVVQTAPGLGDGGGVGQHADAAVDGGKLAVGDTNRLLVVDTQLESSGAPLDQVEGLLGLQGSNSSVALARHNITAVQKSHGHVFTLAGIADHHLVVGLNT